MSAEAIVEQWIEDSGYEDMGLDPKELLDALGAKFAIVEYAQPVGVDEDGVHVFRDSGGTGPFYEGNHEVELIVSPGYDAVEIQPGWEVSPDECVEIARQYLSAAKVAR